MFFSKANFQQISEKIILNELSLNLNYEEWALVVPTNRMMRHLIKQITKQNGHARDLNIFSMRMFANKLAGKIKPFVPLRESAAQAFIDYSIKKTLKENRLKYFSIYVDNPTYSLLEKLRKIFSEYKRLGIDSDKLKEFAKELSSNEYDKTMDIAEIFEIFDNVCREVNAVDLGDAYRIILNVEEEAFYKTFKELFPSLKKIYFIRFNEYSSPEIEIIHRLSKIENLSLAAELDILETSTLYLDGFEEIINNFVEKGFQKIVAKNYQDKIKIFENKFLNFYKNKNEEIQNDFNQNIELYSVQDKKEEIDLIAKIIKKLILEKNVRADQICVLFNVIEEYSDIVKFTFEKYGLPTNFTDRKTLSQTYPISELIAFLEIKNRDYNYRDILRAFSGSFFDKTDIDLNSIKSSAIRLKILKGYKIWINKLEFVIEKVFQNENDDYAKETVSEFENALRSIKKINEHLSVFEDKAAPSKFFNSLILFLNRTNFFNNLLQLKTEEIELSVRSVAKAIESLKEFFELMSRLEQFEGNNKKSFSYYVETMKNIFSSGRFNARERSNDGILITNLNEARGLEFDYVFIGGLYDGNLPSRYDSEVFMIERFRTSEKKHQNLERLMFIRAASSFKEKLFLFYPRFEEKKELSKSLFLRDFEKAFGLQEKNCPLENIIYSEEERKFFVAKQFLIQRDNVLVEKLGSLTEKIEIMQKRKKAIKDKWNGCLFAVSKNYEIQNYLNDIIFNQKLSPSWLEIYAACPFKFFVERILEVKESKEPSEEIEALEIGYVLHKIFERFYSEYLPENELMHALLSSNRRNVENRLFEIAKDEFQKAFNINFEDDNSFLEKDFSQSFYDIEKVFGINGDKSNSMLSEFLNKEKEDSEKTKFLPKYVEKKFGYENEDFIFGGIKLKGKIDRIDLIKEEKKFRIVDYKLSGKNISKEDLRQGLFLQTTIYMEAAREILRKEEGDKQWKPSDPQIFSLKLNADNFGYKKVKCYDSRKSLSEEEISKANLELIEELKIKISEFAKSISNGEFPLSLLKDRENKICIYCQFDGICRVKN